MDKNFAYTITIDGCELKLRYQLDKVMRPHVKNDLIKFRTSTNKITEIQMYLLQENTFEGMFDFTSTHETKETISLANEDLRGFLLSLKQIKDGTSLSFKEDYGVTSAPYISGQMEGDTFTLSNGRSLISGINFSDFYDSMIILKKIIMTHLTHELNLFGTAND